VGVPSAYRFGGERSVYCFSGAEEYKGGDKEEEKDGDAAAALPRAAAFVGAPSVYSCDGPEERKGCDGDAAATYSYAVASAACIAVAVPRSLKEATGNTISTATWLMRYS
jgi:hypothetical protein